VRPYRSGSDGRVAGQDRRPIPGQVGDTGPGGTASGAACTDVGGADRRIPGEPQTASEAADAAHIALRCQTTTYLPTGEHADRPDHTGRCRQGASGIQSQLAQSTANRHVAAVRSIFNFACEREYIAKNPFRHIRGLRVIGDSKRKQYIPTKRVRQLLEKIPDPELQLVIVLARWCGLRIPSEIQELRWRDILWKKNRIVVRSPKTEHHAGKGMRMPKLFPIVRRYLKALRRLRPDAGPDDHVFPIRSTKQSVLDGVSPLPQIRDKLAKTFYQPSGELRYRPGRALPKPRLRGLARSYRASGQYALPDGY
jgi:integrase